MVKWIILLVIPFQSFASDWTPQEIQLQTTYAVMHAIDWKQTLYVSNHPKEYHELNPLLGKHPSSDKVNLYMASSLGLHYFITDSLSHKWRQRFQIFTLALKTGVITFNYRQGL